MKKQMSAEDYRNDKAFSRSQLFKLSKSPAHFKYALENPDAETPALAFGTAFHAYVLERDKFDSEYILLSSMPSAFISPTIVEICISYIDALPSVANSETTRSITDLRAD